MLRVAGFLNHSNVNGEGFRSTLFLSGCYHNCPGCHNLEMQSFNYGNLVPIATIIEEIKKNMPLIDGVTISGGEPFEQADQLYNLLSAIKSLGLSIWVYTGYCYEEICNDSAKASLLPLMDVLVDGKFDNTLACSDLYVGSSNQRILKLSDGKIERLLHY